MALAVVKATKLSSGSGNNCSGAVSATAGNALLVGGSAYLASSTSSTYSVARTGDTYTTDTSGVTAGSVDNTSAGIASAPNVAGGSVTMTVTATNGNGVVAFALEVSGTPTSSIRDAASPAIAQGTGTTATSGALTNATANAIYVGLVADKQSAAGGTVTAGAGWTQSVSPTTMTETDGSSFPVCGFAYQIVASAASRTAAWTINNVAWAAAVAVYKQAAGGGTDVTVTPSVVTATTSVQAPAVSGGATVTPAGLTATATVQAPTVRGGATVTPAVLTATTSVPAPTVTGGATVTPTVLTLTASVQAPTVSTAGGVTVTPAGVTATTSVPAPTVSAGATVSPSVLTATTSVPAPTVSGGATVSPAVLGLTASVPAPTVSVTANPTVTPATLTLTLSVGAPTVSIVVPGSINQVRATVTGGGGFQPRHSSASLRTRITGGASISAHGE